MTSRIVKLVSLAAALALSGALAVGCSSAASSGASGAASSDSAAGVDASTPATATSVDVSTLKTVGDVTALSDNSGFSWNDTHVVCVADGEGMLVRGVATITPEVQQQLDAIDFDKEDGVAKQDEIMYQLALDSVEDLSSGIMTQEQMSQLVGKTGKDLFDQGYTFASYSMYAGEQTIAELDNGFYRYSFTFDAQVPESATEDQGASITDAPIVEVQYFGASNAATDPEQA